MSKPRSAAEIEQSWKSDARWKGVTRAFGGEDVARLAGTLRIEHTLARRGAERLWQRMARGPVRALGALTGNQAVEQVAAGLEAIYCSGWQVAGDANTAGQSGSIRAVAAPSSTYRCASTRLRASAEYCVSAGA